MESRQVRPYTYDGETLEDYYRETSGRTETDQPDPKLWELEEDAMSPPVEASSEAVGDRESEQ